MSSTDGSTATRIWNSNGTYSLRVYKGNNGAANGTLTFAASQDNVISQIVVSGSGTLTASTGTYTNGTWTGSASSVTFTCTANATISTITVTYAGGTAPTSYNVNLTQTTGGTISANPVTAAEGETVTLTATPDNGYSFDSWSITPATVTITNNQFTMPASDVTVTAQWTQSGGGNTGTITITQDEVAGFTNTYAWYNWTANNVSGRMFAYKNSGMQFNPSKDAYWVYNTTAIPGRITSITMTKASSGTDRSWTLKVGNTTLTATNDGTQVGQAQTVGINGATWNVTGNYDHFLLYVSGGATVISSIVINYEVSTDPTIAFSPASIDFGNVVVDEQISETFTVSQANLNADILLSTSRGDVDINSIQQGAAATQVTWTYTPTAAGPINATITASSGTLTETLNITGTAKAAHAINIASMANGTVTASANSAVEGETITLTVTPNTGYTLDALTVTNMTTSQLVNVTNNTFEMPDAPVTVSATFSAIQAMTVAQAITAIDNAANNEVEGAYVRGIISQIDNYSSQYHSITYWISDDGTTATQLQVYSGKGLNGANFNAMTDLAVGDQVVVYGDLKMHNSIYEFNYDNYLYSLSRPSITVNPDVISLAANETDGTTDIAITDIAITDPWEDCHVTFYTDATGATEATQPAWVIDATVAEENNAYLVSCAVYANEGPARTAYFKVYAYDAYQKAVYSNVVTLTQAAVFAPAPTTSGWVLTALEDIVPGDVFVIVGYDEDSQTSYAMTNDNGTTDAPEPVEVTVSGSVLTGTMAENIKWNISGNATTGYTFYPNGDDQTWLYCNTQAQSSSNNNMRVGTGDRKLFVLEDNHLKTNDNYTTRYLSLYYNNQVVQDWRGYTNTGSCPEMRFYKYSNVTTYTKTIQPYSGNGGYVLIAAPVEGVAPTAANGFLTNNYDLYRFDQSRQEEWLNYKAEPFYLIPGKGYLYANSGNNGQATTLTFTGTPYTGNGQITLTNDANADFAGWNLIGNPYATGMVLKDANNANKAFYTLNSAGDELTPGNAGTAIAAMEGVFVEATTDGEVVSFVEETDGGGAGGGGFDFISLNVSRNRGASAGSATIDRAIIGIGDGPMLHKFQLNPSNTKIYITEANQDYAIVRSANEAELPVSFRASENGSYTLSVEVNNVEMNYLHLIDNMTGADADLLATPSYSFEAKTSDYASRFRLVFSASSISEDADGDNAFAYFNGSNWTISNPSTGSGSEATLQVVDVMGRVISSEQINGNAEVNINQPAGVYMLRLVSGDSVKVQKVVVR